MYENPEICSRCGGACCNHMSGAVFPKDVVRPMVKNLAVMFSSGNYVIDWWEGDPRCDRDTLSKAYFIRPRVKSDTSLFSPSWGGTPCVFLGENGCKLASDERPTGCQLLEPREGNRCIYHGSEPNQTPKQEAAIAWIPYRHKIEEAAELRGKA